MRYSIDAAPEFHDWLSTWLTNMSVWSGDAPNEVPDNPRDDPNGGQYYFAEFAFEWTHDKSIIIDQLDGYLSSYADEYQLAYDECGHDDDDVSCEWTVVGGSADPPAHIRIR
jgi:hypothetical protein